MVNKDDHKELVVRLKGGEHAAFKSIFFMYSQSLRAFAIKELKSEELAEDAVQEVFVKLWLNRENLDTQLSLKGFLFTCLKNYILNAVRTRKNEILKNYRFAYQQNVSINDTEYKVIENEIQKGISQLLNQLPELKREILTLSLYQGKSHEEISQDLGVSINTVKMYLSQSSRLLTGYIEMHGIKLLLLPFFDLLP